MDLGFWSFLGSLCKSGSWRAFELKEVMDKVKDNVCVGVCFVDLLWISGDFRWQDKWRCKSGSGILVLLGIYLKSGSWVCVRGKRR